MLAIITSALYIILTIVIAAGAFVLLIGMVPDADVRVVVGLTGRGMVIIETIYLIVGLGFLKG